MKVVIAHRSGEPAVVELPDPRMGRNFVLVRVSHTAIRLPDELNAIAGAAKRLRKGEDGLPLGSCASGTIIDCGSDVTKLKTGLRVAATGAPHVFHGTVLAVPENLAVELPKKVSHEEGSFAGVGAAALHLLRTGGVELGSVVLVYGADILGLLTAQCVRAAGAMPVLLEESEFRQTKARSLGLPCVMHPASEELLHHVEQITDGAGADAALLTRPDDMDAFHSASHLLRPGGHLVFGAPMAKAISLAMLREKGINLHAASGGGIGSGERDYELGQGYPRALARWTLRDNMTCFCGLLAERRVQLAPLVTDRVPLERAPMAYEKALRGRDAVLGVVLTV